MKTKWKDKTLIQKTITIISMIIGALIVLVTMLKIFDIWDKAMNVAIPLLGLEYLCNAYIQWKTNKKTAYVCIGAAIFAFICSIGVFYVCIGAAIFAFICSIGVLL